MSDPIAVFHELGDPTRLSVLVAILRGRKNVSTIVSELGLSQPQVSYHLKKLKDAGLAVEEKDGRWVWYEANRETDDARVRELLELVARWSGGETEHAQARVPARAAPRGRGGLLRGAGVMRQGSGRRKRATIVPASREPGREDAEGRPVVERPKKRDDDLDDFLL